MNEFRLSKMVAVDNNPVQYYIVNDNSRIHINELIGTQISVEFMGRIVCRSCGCNTPKSFAQGYCYNCFITSPETEACVLKPELCLAQWNIARDLEWANTHHLSEHVVYLAFTNSIKVGVTRKTQMPTRWIDQGAIIASALLQLPNRHIAGVVECFMKSFFNDKTNWRKMLMLNRCTDGFNKAISLFLEKLPEEFKQYLISEPVLKRISYPLENGLQSPKSLTLDKLTSFSKKLTGIKGQYLVFSDQTVFNVRKHAGYVVNFSSC